jgi:hypothetical protein
MFCKYSFSMTTQNDRPSSGYVGGICVKAAGWITVGVSPLDFAR